MRGSSMVGNVFFDTLFGLPSLFFTWQLTMRRQQ